MSLVITLLVSFAAGWVVAQLEIEYRRSKQKKKEVRCMQVLFDAYSLARLEELRRATGKSTSEVVQDAIGFYAWSRQQTENGDRSFAIVDHDKKKVTEYVI